MAISLKGKEQERQESLTWLREILTPGDVLYTILRHVSQSGMQRRISVLHFSCGEDGQVRQRLLDYHAARALGWSLRRGKEGIVVDGAGMDMGFHLVYSLSWSLWPDGYLCTGQGCVSNDHFNGDRDYTPHLHTDGGYALKNRWL